MILISEKWVFLLFFLVLANIMISFFIVLESAFMILSCLQIVKVLWISYGFVIIVLLSGGAVVEIDVWIMRRVWHYVANHGNFVWKYIHLLEARRHLICCLHGTANIFTSESGFVQIWKTWQVYTQYLGEIGLPAFSFWIDYL